MHGLRIPPVLMLAVGLLAAGPVLADDISWTYFEAAAQNVDPDVASSEIGYRFEGSLNLLLGFHAFARWEQADLDDVGGDLSAADFGLGWHFGLGDTAQAFVEAAYTDREAGPFDDDGYSTAVGVRLAPGERWEFGAKAGYRDLAENLDGGYGEGYILWKPFPLLGFTARAELAEDANRYGIGARISF
jgi:hypothetical protein